ALRVERRAGGCRSGNVREGDGDELAVLQGPLTDRGAARRAESCSRRYRGRTARARSVHSHVRSLHGSAGEMNSGVLSYRAMPLSAIQKGAIGQFAFLVAALVTGRGQIEVYTPAADNEGRDAEVRRHLRRLAGIGIQVKIAFGLSKTGGRRKYLAVTFSIAKTRLRNDPRLWYFIGLYDERQLRLQDPVF